MDRDNLYRNILKTKNMTKAEAREHTKRILRNSAKKIKHQFIMITDDEINASDYSQVHKFFHKLERQWRAYEGRVMLVVDGYDDVTEELYEIPEVKQYFQLLYSNYPHYLFFLSEATESFQMAVAMLMQNYIKSSNATETFIERLDRFDGDFEGFENEMERLAIEVMGAIDNKAYSGILNNLMLWGKEKNDMSGALKVANRLKDFEAKFK